MERNYFVVAIPEAERTERSGAFCVMNADGRLTYDGFHSVLEAEEFITEWEK